MAKQQLEPFIYRNVTVIRIIDGDTVECMVDLGFRTRYQDNFRLTGIDTPERGKPGFYEASEYMESLLKKENFKIELETMKGDKYGRWLAEIRSLTTGESLNKRMITEGHAVEYHGGKKKTK